jgi:hypothetical protein
MLFWSSVEASTKKKSHLDIYIYIYI